MSFHKATSYSNVFRKVKIDVSEELNCQDTFVVFREPKTEEAMILRTASTEEDGIKAFRSLLPKVLVDHNFYTDEAETEKMDAEDVVQILYDSFQAFQKVLSEYSNSVFRAK